MYSMIEGFFDAVIRGDEALCERINKAKTTIYFNNGQLMFDLNSLHGMIFSSNQLSFQAFKKLLYGGQLNTYLRTKGVHVVVIKNVGKVSGNIYGLVKNLI